MRFRRMLLPFALAGGLLVGQGTPQDDRIYDQVRMKLAADPVVGGGAIDVAVKEGRVTLSGRVRTEQIKNKAGQVAKKVKGVKEVTNQLVVLIS